MSEISEHIRDRENFKKVRVSRLRTSFLLVDEDDGVDFGCDRLREIAEEQAELFARAS